MNHFQHTIRYKKLTNRWFYLQNQLQLSRRHISKAKYEIRFSSSDGTKFIFLTESETDEKHFFQCASGTTKYEIPFPLKPTKEYEINVFRGECLDHGRFTLSEHGSLKFQAGISTCFCQFALQYILTSNKINEIQIILQQWVKVVCLRYTNERPSFAMIELSTVAFISCTGTNHTSTLIKFVLMKRYMKNDGGDQASPLNRAIPGLFFSAFYLKNCDGQLIVPPTSPFGDQRFHVAVPFFLNSKNNLYFADFYCHYTNHHVTLVVTEANSESDKFCKENLIFLESINNPFLYYNRSKHCFFINTSVNVEVFYTENIDSGRLLSCRPNYAFFTFCGSVGDSRTKSFIGQSKNINCDICNLNTL